MSDKLAEIIATKRLEIEALMPRAAHLRSAALQRNDPALKKLELSELRACSWPARALRLFRGAVVTVALTGHGVDVALDPAHH